MTDRHMVVIAFAVLLASLYYLKPIAEDLFWEYMYKKHKKPGAEISKDDFRMLLILYWRMERQEWLRREINRLYLLPVKILAPIALALDFDLLIDWTNSFIRLYHFRLYSSYFNRRQKGTAKPNFIRVESVERKNDVAFVTLYFEGDSFAKYAKYVKSCLNRYAEIPESAIHCQKIDAHHLLCLAPENIGR